MVTARTTSSVLSASPSPPSVKTLWLLTSGPFHASDPGDTGDTLCRWAPLPPPPAPLHPQSSSPGSGVSVHSPRSPCRSPSPCQRCSSETHAQAHGMPDLPRAENTPEPSHGFPSPEQIKELDWAPVLGSGKKSTMAKKHRKRVT